MGRAMRRRRGTSRRGNYAILMTVALTVPLGFGALAVDASYIRLAQTQAQDIADAASQSALFMLRRTGEKSDATAAAEAVIARNKVGTVSPELDSIEFGTWNYDTETFGPTTLNPNAVKVRVKRAGDNALGLFLARTLGFDKVDVHREAVSATRNLQVILVMDITGSWGESDFAYARDASLAFWDVLAKSYSDYDLVGMTIFSNRFGWEYTPMTLVRNAVTTNEIDNSWSVLNIASKAGTDHNHYDGWNCSLKSGSEQNDFTDPDGGCYPDMPREYRDEPGTDHTTGMRMAEIMFEENPDPAAYRAMIVLTDGRPNGYGSIGTSREVDYDYGDMDIESYSGYEVWNVDDYTRYRTYARTTPHGSSSIRSQSIALTGTLWEDYQVNTWVVSFITNESFMQSMPRGDGYYELTNNPEYIIEIFEDIANSLPLAIVQ